MTQIPTESEWAILRELDKYFYCDNYQGTPVPALTAFITGLLTITPGGEIDASACGFRARPAMKNLTHLPVRFTWCRSMNLSAARHLTTLEGLPRTINWGLVIQSQDLTSLAHLPESCMVIELLVSADMGLLRLLMIKDLERVDLRDPSRKTEVPKIKEIINRYLTQGKAGLSACATELIKAGFKGNAKL